MATNITKLRSEIPTLQTERDTLRNAPPTRTEADAVLKSFCARAAAMGDTRIGYAVLTDQLGDALVCRDRLPDGSLNLAPILAGVLGASGLYAALEKHLDQFNDGPNATARAERIAAIGLELDRLEREEERLIVVSESTGSPIARRPDARPEIVLEVLP